MEFLGTIERELPRDSIYLVLGRSPFVATSSLSPRIFQIDVLEHSVFVKYFLCRMKSMNTEMKWRCFTVLTSVILKINFVQIVYPGMEYINKI